MYLVTIQSKKVLNTLLDGKLYRADFPYIFKSFNEDETNKALAYQILMRYYYLKSAPIFCCALDRLSCFNGTNPHNKVLIELNVPDNEVRSLHAYAAWLYILKNSNSWNVDENEKYKPYFYSCEPPHLDLITQAILAYICPNWLTAAYKIDKHFIDNFEDANKLNVNDYNHYDSLYMSLLCRSDDVKSNPYYGISYGSKIDDYPF